MKTIRRDWVIFDLKHEGLISRNWDLDFGIKGWAASLQRAKTFETREEADKFSDENNIKDYVLLSTNDIDVPL